MPKHASNSRSHARVESSERSSKVDKAAFVDDRDGRIGLTEAFSPVAPDTVAPPINRENAIGLTEAFQPVKQADSLPGHARRRAIKKESENVYPDVVESLEPVDAPPLLFDDTTLMPQEPVGRHGRTSKPSVPAHQRKSRRMRRILMMVVVLLFVLIGVLCYFAFTLISENETRASQQTQAQQSTQEVTSIQKEDAKDASTETTTKKTTAPNLAVLLGLTQDEAIVAIKQGAKVTSVKDINEEGNPIKKNVTVALTDEPADTRTGTPTVYLGLSEEGKVIQTGYSAATSSLGYGSLSFIDAVKNDHIVEKTLREAGINVVDGSAVLPEDKATYSAYSSDGKMLVKENYAFSGMVDINSAAHEWSSVLSYDYATANMTGNLADTIRVIYIYVNA